MVRSSCLETQSLNTAPTYVLRATLSSAETSGAQQLTQENVEGDAASESGSNSEVCSEDNVDVFNNDDLENESSDPSVAQAVLKDF